MSIGTRRPYEIAVKDAEDFVKLLLPAMTCKRIEIAGSIRRHKSDVGDVDIVAEAVFADVVVEENLLGAVTESRNMLWQRLDDLLAAGQIKKNIRSNGSTCWGDRIRSVDFRGYAYDVNLADEHNYGPLMAIKTGPAELSALLADKLPKLDGGRPLPRGFGVKDGFHLYDMRGYTKHMVERCTEEQFFAAAGLVMKRPELR